jgi:hypothetical protein
MSLNHFHIIFILASLLCSFFFCYWGVQENNIGAIIASICMSLALMIYLLKAFVFLKNAKGLLSFALCALLLGYTSELCSCSVCFGSPNDLAVKGMANGIVVLLFIVGFLWLTFAAFFIRLWKRAKAFGEQ